MKHVKLALLFTTSMLYLSSMSGQVLAEERILYEYGFEDELNGWQTQDPWTLTQDDAHTGAFSAFCPMRGGLLTSLTSPSLEIPGEAWKTHFDFWVRCDLRLPDTDGDNFLDDYFKVQVSANRGEWQDVIYEYGRDEHWQMDWNYYEPGTFFRNDMDAWRVNLDLTQFAGQGVRLRWRIHTDGGDEEGQGTGLYVDDFRLIANNMPAIDVGAEWLHIAYPATFGFGINGATKLTNFGTSDQPMVRTYVRADTGRVAPVVPWAGLESGQSSVRNFSRLATSNDGIIKIKSYVQVNDDSRPNNDTAALDVMVFPANTWQLGYDDRRWTEPIQFDQGGVGVLFTPPEDRIEGSFSIYGVEAYWAEGLQQDAHAVMKIWHSGQGVLGAEIYSEEIVIHPADVYPRQYYIDLVDVVDIKHIQENFWVTITPAEGESLPAILGRTPEDQETFWGADHYYNVIGERVREVGVDFQLRAIVTNGQNSPANLVVQPRLAFGELGVDRPKTIRLVVMGGGVNPVTIERVVLQSEEIRVTPFVQLPVELSVGETASFDVRCSPEEVGEVTADLEFITDAEDASIVHITGVADRTPVIELEQNAIDFGRIPVGERTEQVLTIFNSGDADLVISGALIEGRHFHLEFNQPITIQPNSDQSVIPFFIPEQSGQHNNTLVLTCNDPYNRTVAVRLSGFGLGNLGPSIVHPIGDQHLQEDFEPHILADLDTIFQDPDADVLTFTVSTSDEELFSEIDDQNCLWLLASPDWYGVADVTVSAEDGSDQRIGEIDQPSVHIENLPTLNGFRLGIGGNSTPAQSRRPKRDHRTDLTFAVEAAAVDDAPPAFDLIQPPDGSIFIYNRFPVHFAWDNIRNVDNDTISYELDFEIHFRSIDTTFTFTDLNTSFIDLPTALVPSRLGIFETEQDSLITLIWSVKASDGITLVESSSRRTVTFPLPLSTIDDGRPLPRQLSLQQPFPNPFNNQVTIAFTLQDYSSPFTMKVVDLAGRTVADLTPKAVTGSHPNQVVWTANEVGSGVYLIQLEQNGVVKSHKVVLMR